MQQRGIVDRKLRTHGDFFATLTVGKSKYVARPGRRLGGEQIEAHEVGRGRGFARLLQITWRRAQHRGRRTEHARHPLGRGVLADLDDDVVSEFVRES